MEEGKKETKTAAAAAAVGGPSTTPTMELRLLAS